MATLFLTKREIIAQLFSFLLGLASSAFPTYTAIVTSITAIFYLLIIAVLPSVHPTALLTEARNQITDTRISLDDEAATRRSSPMYVITAQGRDRLESAEQRVRSILHQHERDFRMCNAFQYTLALPKLVIDARRCQSVIVTLRAELEDEIHQLGD